MKEVIIKNKILHVLKLAMLVLLFNPLNLVAQTDSTAVVVEETVELISPTLDFTVIQKADNTIDLRAAIRAKIDGSLVRFPLLKISFFQVDDTDEKNLGFVITDRNGKAVLNVKKEALMQAKDGSVNFKAVFAGNKKMESANGEMAIKQAVLQLTPVKEDSIISVKVKFIVPIAGAELNDLTVGLFVKRTFSALKIGEGTTDENGEVTIEVPNNLPGDAKGAITLLSKIDENEIYGNLEASVTQPWGLPVSDKLEKQPRTLWSAHPPLWMLVTFIVLMVVVWGHFIVIVYELFRLRKEEPLPKEALSNV